MLKYQLLNAPQVVGANSTVAGQADRRLQPELGTLLFTVRINVGSSFGSWLKK